jgi:patatin-related protein
MLRFAVAVAFLYAMSASALDNPPAFPQGRGVRELRAAVVCYGGVSLAIYMYGNVRELHHLALASSALECDAGGDPRFCGSAVKPGVAYGALPPSAKPYYEALVKLWDDDPNDVRTRVVIDIISGTSAGGINGIFLAKALTHNRSIEGLRHLWFEEADIRKLATGRPWWLRAPLRVLGGKSALGGDSWLKELHLALKGMDHPDKAGQPAIPSLLGLDQPLDLLVTSTDFYGTERPIEVGDPPVVSELRYDHVYRFSALRNGSGLVQSSQFEDKDNVALAFAGRSSASFPVAFPAIPIEQLKKALDEPSLDTAALADRFFRDRVIDLQNATNEDFAKHLFLVDGGVLNNYPFSIAHRRVSGRSPSLETRRVFLYLEPDPRVPRALSGFQGQDSPKALQMLLGAKSSIPGAQPIAQDLLEIHQHNQRVRRIGEIIRQDERRAQDEWVGRHRGTSVASQIEQSMKVDLDPKRLGENFATPDSARDNVRKIRDEIDADAASRLGLAEEAYIRLRVASVLDQFSRVLGRAVCGLRDEYDGPRTALMREIVRQWAAEQPFMGSTDEAAKARVEFLNAYDLGHLRRKLRFVDDWLNAQYAPKEGQINYNLQRAQLQAAQVAISEQVQTISGCVSGQCLAELGLGDKIEPVRGAICVRVEGTPADHAASILKNPEARAAIDALAAAVGKGFLKKQEDVLATLYATFIRQTVGWPDNGSARAVLARYLGFPYWDRVAYPYTAFSGVGDLAYIDINRMSPADAQALSIKGAGKLVGEGLGHFKAFLSADGRQTDYLWGRFDGAERLLHVIGVRNDPARVRSLLQKIMEDEKNAKVMSPKNLNVMEQCLLHPKSC